MTKPLLIFAPLMLAALLPSKALAPLPEQTEPLDFFPADTLALVEAHGTGDWLGRAQLDQLVDVATRTGLLDAEAERRLEGALDFARFFAGADPLDLAGDLTAGGLALGLLGTQPEPSWGLVLEARDAEQLATVRETAFAWLEDKYDAAGQLSTPRGQYRGADYWLLGDELALGQLGKTLALAGNKAALQALFDQAAGGEPGLSQRTDLALDPTARLNLWFDRAGTTAFASELGANTKKLTALASAAHLPQVQFLLGPGLADLGSARTLTAALHVDTGGLGLELVGHAPESHTGLEPGVAAAPPELEQTGSLASGLVFRDVGAIVARRNELFAPELQPKFSKALGDLALLFGGMELDEELLPAIEPWIEFTLRELDFGESPRPSLALPGAALVLRVDESLKDTLVAGFQTTLGITNAERAQKGQPAFTLGLGLEGEVLVTSGHMPRPGQGEPVDNAYNLAPAAAYVEGQGHGLFVIGSHEAIVRDVVAELAEPRSTAPATGPIAEQLRVDASGLAQLARTSRDYLAMQAVLDEGKSFEAAGAEIDGLVRLIELFRAGTLSVQYPEGGDIVVDLELGLEPGLLAEEQR